MRSELFRIPLEIGGAPLFGVGWLLAVWVIIACAALAWVWTNQQRRQEFWSYAFPALIGAAMIFAVPRLAPEGIPIRGYGVMLLLAVSTGLAMMIHRAKARGIHPDLIFSLAFWLFIAGIAGARLFFVIEYWDVRFAGQDLKSTLVDVLRFTEGGLVVYGSLIGASLAFVLFTRRHKLPVLGMADMIAPSLVAGLAIGRLGCLLNGCCYGGSCDLPWAVTFPQGSPAYMDQLVHGEMHGLRLIESLPSEGKSPGLLVVTDKQSNQTEPVSAINGRPAPDLISAGSAFSEAHATGRPVTVETTEGRLISAPPSTNQRSLPVHPTQVYSAINAGLLAWLLWAYYPHRRHEGEVMLLLLTIYPVSRFLLEIIRTDEDAIFGTGMSISQNVSIVILVLACLAWTQIGRSPATTES